MKKLLPIIIAVIGLGGGLTAGSILKPDAMAGDSHSSDLHGEQATADHGGDHGGGHGKDGGEAEYAYVGLKKPFFAPVLRNDNRHTLVRLDIHLEVPSDMEDKVALHEPKLRDGFLRAVMSFAHEGGFTRVHGSKGFEVLSDDLLLSARAVLGEDVKAVLIGEILTRDG